MYIALSSNNESYSYFSSFGVISSPVEISISKLTFKFSNFPIMLYLFPPYSSSCLMSVIFTTSNLTPSFKSIDNISLITSIIFSLDTSIPFTEISMSLVLRLSIPNIAERSNPPFRIKLSLYFEFDILSKILSNINL